MLQGDQGAGKKIVLPSSGLAEDILGRVAMAGVEPAPVVVELEEDEPVYGEAVQDDESVETLHLVGFLLNSEEYALDISQVQEIIRVNGWTRVPNAPDYIKGVINLRGRIIPVVDPKVRMGAGDGGLTRESRIMVVEVGRKIIGMLVDNVSQVMRLPLSTVEPPPDEVSVADKSFVRGVGKMDGRLILLLELDRLLGKDDKTAVAVS